MHLKKVKNSIGKSFNDAVDLLSKCQSKVILCGVGKSGLLHQKFQQHFHLLELHLLLYLQVIVLMEI